MITPSFLRVCVYTVAATWSNSFFFFGGYGKYCFIISVDTSPWGVEVTIATLRQNLI